jgi:WD40 repeat protein
MPDRQKFRFLPSHRHVARTVVYAGLLELAQREMRESYVGNADKYLADCPGPLRHFEHRYLSRLSRRRVRTLATPLGVLGVAAFSPDGRRLARPTTDRKVLLWDTSAGRAAFSFPAPAGRWACGVAFSPDGKLLAASSGNFNDYRDSRPADIAVWDTATGKEVHTLKGHRNDVDAVAFSPDGKRLASGGRDAVLKLWDVDAGTQVREFKGHTGIIQCLAFSPDGKTLASGSWDQSVRLWDLATGRQVLALDERRGGLRGVQSSPDGNRVVAVGGDNAVHVWDAGP